MLLHRKSIHFILMFVTTCFLVACVNYNDVTKGVTLKVQVSQPQDLLSPLQLEGKTVTITLNGTATTAKLDASGVAVFNDIVPDVYTISTSWNLTSAEYALYTGDNNVTQGAQVTGNLAAQSVLNDAEITLPTQLSVDRDIIIGKVYNSGSKDKNNKAYQAGKYIELYNQSDKAVDVAGLYIGLVESGSNPAYTLANIKSTYADSVVLLKQVFRIPQSYSTKLASGGTLLLVNSAIDHSVSAPLENDLTGADFEAKDVKGKTANNAAVPALELIFSNLPAISYMNLVQGGPCGVVIFRTNADVANLPKTYQFGKTSGTEWLVLPVSYVLDGVDILKYKATGVDISSKRLVEKIDVGFTNVGSASGGTGEVSYRKTSRKNNNRVILQDTNNSSNDFKVSTSIKIRNYDN